ncbi:MAG: hypothetical protein JAY90_23355 [Candidatus Thiodiazotropha lotti]|nr:hypothetical protein [Candidatus Thiodiazotropha lotti]
MQTINEIISTGQSHEHQSVSEETEAMPLHWVSALFDRLHARYGTKWMHQYPTKLEQLALTEWHEKLSGMTAEDIRRGLDRWDGDWPPSLPEFVKACKPSTVQSTACHRKAEVTSRLPVNKELAKQYIEEMHSVLR